MGVEGEIHKGTSRPGATVEATVSVPLFARIFTECEMLWGVCPGILLAMLALFDHFRVDLDGGMRLPRKLEGTNHMKLVTALRAIVLMALLLPMSADAVVGQEAYPIEIGDRVRVSVPMQIDGDLVGFADGELIIHIPNHIDLTSVPLEALQGLQVERVKTKSLLFGVIGGVVAGAGAWLLVEKSNAVTVESLAPEETDRRVYTSAFAAVGGAFAGALIGKRYKTFRWEVIPLATIQSQVVEPDGLGVRATWTLP